MWRFLSFLVGSLLISGLFYSCDDSAGIEGGPEFDFAYVDILDTDTSGWIGGFADYPDSLSDKLNFKVEFVQLSNAFPSDNKVLKISAANPHKDLFYYVARKFEGLEPNTSYMIGTTFELQAALLTDTAGTFPLDIYFKMGVSQIMPEPVLDISSEVSKYKLSLSKGENEVVGSDFVYLGKPDPGLKVGVETPKIIRNGDITVTKTIKSNSEGELWVTIGMDSKTEFEMAFSFNTIVVYFKEL